MTTEPPESAPEETPHEADGLELARRLAAATASAPAPTPEGRRRRRPGDPASGPAGAEGDADQRERRSRPRSRHGMSGAHPDERDPQTLDSTVARLVGGRGWDLELRVRGVFVRWPEVVGEEVAAHAVPESFADGRLVVRTDSTAWATQLTLLAPQLVRRLNDDLGPGTVTVVDVQGPLGPTWKRGRRSVRGGRGPRDTYG